MVGIESDLTSDLSFEMVGNAEAPTSLAEQLSTESPPVVRYLTGAEDSAPVLGGSTSTPPASAPGPVINSTIVGGKVALGMTPTRMDHVKDALGAAQDAVVSPVRSGFTKAAKALGASDDTANSVAQWALPAVVAVLLGILGTVYALRHRIFSHKITA